MNGGWRAAMTNFFQYFMNSIDSAVCLFLIPALIDRLPERRSAEYL